jgi:hypothetical protein
MMETRQIRQDTTAVHDVLSLFRDKTVHDVMNPDNYSLHRHPPPQRTDCPDVGRRSDRRPIGTTALLRARRPAGKGSRCFGVRS